jgi:hypothetical protein
VESLDWESIVRTTLKTSVMAALGMILSLGAAARATPVVTLLNNTGTLTDTFYGTPAVSVATYPYAYGIPPAVPYITEVTSGWQLTFAPNMLATANNSTGGERQVLDGGLSFFITFDSPIQLTANVFEDGMYGTTGNGAVSVTEILIVSDAAGTETHHNNFPAASYANGYWSLTDQVTGFSGSYTTYKISLDNILQATSLASEASGSAMIAKKDFTITITTDGGGGGVPEPASLGVLAMGSLALMARRRRV